MKESVFRALADPHRRKILKLLGKKSMTAGEIAEHFQLAKSTLSGHFGVLKSADLIQEERRGTSIIYSLNLSVVEETLAGLMDLLNTGRQPQFQPEIRQRSSVFEDKLA
jgi:ArsR family transcriptional regulator